MKRMIAIGVATLGLVLLTTTEGVAGDCDNIPATKTISEDRVADSLCNATCGALSRFNMSGPMASGATVGFGRLEWVDQWQGQCRVNGGPLNGQCTSDTTCLPGQTRFADGGVWKCKSTMTIAVPNPDKAACVARSADPVAEPPNPNAAREVAVLIAQKGGMSPAAEAKWRDAARDKLASDLPGLVVYVLREAKKQNDEDVRYQKNRIAELNRKKAVIDKQLNDLKANDRRVKRSDSKLDDQIKKLEAQLQAIGDDAQLANVDLQNTLQKQQQVLQTMSNISKMLYDTAQSVIRKMGG